MSEIWKDIAGYEGKYQVSSWGNVRNAKTGKYLTPYKTKKGYLKVGLKVPEKKSPNKYRVNRLVAEVFIPNPSNLPQVNHKDGNKENNSVSNLEWCDNSSNQKHAKKLREGNYTEITHTTTIREIRG